MQKVRAASRLGRENLEPLGSAQKVKKSKPPGAAIRLEWSPPAWRGPSPSTPGDWRRVVQHVK